MRQLIVNAEETLTNYELMQASTLVVLEGCEGVVIDLWGSRLLPHAQAAAIASRSDASEKMAIADAILDSIDLRRISIIDGPTSSSKTTTQA